MKTLSKSLTLQPLWTTYMQCLKALSDYLDLGNSTPWVFGATGHAFIMNISPDLCPSGPTAFSQKPINALTSNLGFDLSGTIFDKTAGDFKAQQETAWNMTRMAIDNDLPSFGWELKIPEYYVIHGYDKENYLFYDQDGKTLKKKWNTLGESQIGVVSIFSASPVKKKGGTNKTLKDAFTFALEFSRKPKEWTYPSYTTGLKAYDTWIDSLQQEKFNPFGLAYNAQVWAECRTYAVEFLKEAKKRARTKLLDNLIEHYDVVAWSLQKVARLFPMGVKDIDSESIETAIDTLFLAQEAEKAALAEMRPVLSQL
jgi:hypothetical protein